MEESQPSASQLVVVGSSAGGIEALSTLLSTVPEDFPAPIVLAQHLDPSRASHLQEILGRASKLEVRTVTQPIPLEPGTVYVVPANQHVEITDHTVGLSDSAEPRPMPSVDLLLGTAARVFKDGLYAVILTGTGSDGADGAWQVKEAGGTVIIQNPETASFPGMPLSLAPTTVDIVADIEAIGMLLYDLLTGAYTPPSPDADRRMRALLDQLRARSGIDFSQYRRPTIRRRLERRMADTGKPTLDEYIGYLQRHPEEYQRLARSFLIKVTDFFRDTELFSYMRERVLPELLAEARQNDNQLRCWSAGCATGEEAYSLAILLTELLGDDLESFSLRIYATDLDADAVAFARRGIYPGSAVRGLAPELLDRYFSPRDGAYEVKKTIRRLVIFAPHDLGQRAPFPRIDLVLCRNVLIYFTPELQRRALQLFAFSLRPGGRLIVGKSESTGPLTEYYALEHPRLKVYRRQGERLPIPPAQVREGGSARELDAPLRPHFATFGLASSRAQGGEQQPPGRETADRVFLELPVGVAVVDQHYDVQAINVAARRLLSIHSVAVGEDLLHLARRVPVDRLRRAIDQALRGQQTSERLEAEPLDVAPGERRLLEVTCSPHPSEPSEQRINQVVLLISDVTPSRPKSALDEPERPAPLGDLETLLGRVRSLAEAESDPTKMRELLTETSATLEAGIAELSRLTGLSRQLDANRQELLQANEQLTTANADLMSQNEELLVANEQSQAAIEEVETLSEEQQASNEELETLNEELQATIEELHTTNEDLEARGVELQELATSLEAERAQLAAILGSMGDAVLVIDRGGRPILTNAAFDRIFGDAEFVAEDERGEPLLPEARPQQRAVAGETFSMSFTIQQPDGSRCWFEANAQPIKTDGHDAAVLVIRDITERSLLHLQNDFLAMASHELNTPLTALSGSLQMLDRLTVASGDARGQHYVRMGLAQVHLLSGLTRDLTDAVRLQAGRFRFEPRPIDLVQLVRDSIELVSVQANGRSIRLSLSASSLAVNGDPERLQQVLVNVLSNALKYAPESEHVDVRASHVNGLAEVEVRDYGPGIPQADLERVFSRFYQASPDHERAPGGLGLGLYISHEIVRIHGGNIAVSSPDGGGAAFTIRLPLGGE